MTPKRTYINLINDFWDKYAQEPISAPASMVYFYLLNRINRNRWQPVFISNVELAQGANIARRGLPGYKAEIAAAGLLLIEDQGEGRTAGTVYAVPEETAQKGTVKLRKNAHINRANLRNSNEETAQKGTVNCAKTRILEPITPYNVYNKTSIRPSTTTEDNAQARNVVVEVEAEEVEILEVKNSDQISGAADLLLEKKRRAAAQGAEVLKAFFDDTNRYSLEVLCMQNHVTDDQLRGIAERIVADWTQDGKTHDDYKGNFDIGEAVKHLRMTIPKKAAAEARGEVAPKTRAQSRQDLMAGAIQNLRNVIARDGQPQQDGQPDNPF